MGLGPAAAVRPRRRRLLLPVAVTALLAACSGTPTPTAEAPESAPATRTSAPTPSGSSSPAYSDWELGASPLPLRPDGFGEMPATPPELRERRFRTEDRLPPPEDGRFRSSIAAITPEVRRRMGETWSPGCPVPLEDLRHLTVSFRGFDGAAHTGELVVAASEAEGVVSVFEALYAADFPIEEMRLPTTADLEAAPTGDGNNTAGLVCRAARGDDTWSAHALGLAIDLNPFQNPYRRDDVVLPELARAYLDRDWERPGMVAGDGLAVREFARIGWSWGGDWRTLKDYQHFSANGR